MQYEQEQNQQNVTDDDLANNHLGSKVPVVPLAPPAMGPLPAMSGSAPVLPSQEADSRKFKVRNLINELIQTGNTFSVICQQITGVLIRNYVLIAQHIPPEKLNDAILNFFILAAVPKKSGYTLASNANTGRRTSTDKRIFQNIELVEKDSDDAILQEFFPQYDTEQGALIASPRVAEMLQQWDALSNLTVFYNDHVNALCLNIFQDKFATPKDSDKEQLLESFIRLFEQLLAHCDQEGVSVATQEWRRFLLIRALVPSEIQWQTLLQDVAEKYALDLNTLSDSTGFMQCLVNGSALLKSAVDSTEVSFGHVIAERIFSITQPRHPMPTQARPSLSPSLSEETSSKAPFPSLSDMKGDGYKPIIFQVMMFVTWSKQTNSMRNGRYPNDSDIVTQQLIASVQRLPRLELFFTSIEKYIDVDAPNFLQTVQYIRAKIAELLKKVDSGITLQKMPSQVDTSHAKPRAVIKNKGRLAVEIRRLKTLVQQGVGNIGEMFLRDSSRIHYSDKADKRRRRTTSQRVPPLALSPAAPSSHIVVAAESSDLPRRLMPKEQNPDLSSPSKLASSAVRSHVTERRPAPVPTPAVPTRSVFRSHWVAPIPGRTRVLNKSQPQRGRALRTRRPVFVVPAWVRKLLAVVLGLLFLASLVALIGTLSSGQLSFSTTLGHIDFVKNFAEWLTWGKDVFLGIFIGSSSTVGSLLLAFVFAVVGLKRDSAAVAQSVSQPTESADVDKVVMDKPISQEGYSAVPTRLLRTRQDDRNEYLSTPTNVVSTAQNMPNP